MAKATSQSLLGRLQQFGSLGASQKIAILFGLAALVAVAVAAWSYASAPQYRVLYTNLSDRDGGEIVGALSQMNVPYKMADGGGAIMVPSGQVYDVRLKLAAQGLPKGSTVGFEIMENQKLGTSQFIEQVNYQRALEGELTRSIESISAVKGARVHLAIPRQSVFVRDQQKPSASILVSLYPGRSLDAAQAAGIARLVAAGVPDLAEKNVTIVDQNGNLLSKAGRDGGDQGLDAGQLDYRGQIEQGIARHIEAILSPITGPANVRAQVTADIDFSSAEQTSEQYKPNGTPETATMRSQQTRETTGGGAQASGVPGAASNQPGGDAAQSKPAPAAGSKETVVNYEVDKTVRQVREAAGAIKRLSVAVVVNQKKIVNRDGTTKMVPFTPAEMDQFNNLVKDAMGFNQGRGDTVNVVNSAFNQPDDAQVPDEPFYKKPETLSRAFDLLRMLGAAAVVLVVFFSVRRMILQMVPPVAAAPAVPAAAPGDPAAAAAARPAQALEDVKYESTIATARDIARNDPQIVASVVKDWLANE